jgi:hypothetical protein
VVRDFKETARRIYKPSYKIFFYGLCQEAAISGAEGPLYPHAINNWGHPRKRLFGHGSFRKMFIASSKR